MKVFKLPKDILENLQIPNATEPTEIAQLTIEPEQSETFELTCQTCQFQTNVKSHFRSDWHRYNIKKKLNNQSPISEQEFEDREDLSSIENDSDDEEEEAPKKLGSPFVNFKIANGEYAGKELLIWKQVLAPYPHRVDDFVGRLMNMQLSKKPKMTWSLFLMASGHFSGAVIDCETGNEIASKTFHRYTTRRKQGGAQSGNDNSKGKAKSAGAQIRRYNEQALRDEIQQLMVEWQSLIQSTSLIFIRAPVQMQRILFFEPSILTSTDVRVRSFPFVTKRPTLKEITRCFELLANCEITLPAEHEEPKPKIAEEKQEVVQTHFQYEPPKSIGIDLSENEQKIFEAIKKGRLEFLKSMIVAEDLDQTFPEPLVSYLHAASSNAQLEILDYLLELGADPTIACKGQRPYDSASSKETRDVFRRFMARYPDRWDYKKANIPGPLTPEMEEQAAERDRLRRKKERERKKLQPKIPKVAEPELVPQPTKDIKVVKLTAMEKQTLGMTPEQKMRFEREKRAMSAEARFRTSQNQCGHCGKSLVGLQTFDKSIYRYCSMECLKKQQILF